ncbi:MAG: hypothetical protein ACYC56_08285, partial [Candidatus Aquicultor sp.]
IRNAFGVKEPLPISEGFYKFGTVKAKNLKPGVDYTLEISDKERHFTYTMVDWINWSARHPQMLSTGEAIRIATDFCKNRGLFSLDVAKVDSEVQKTEYLEPGHKPVAPPVVWVRFQGRIDDYPLIDTDGRPEMFSWIQVGIGQGGKILTASGMLPAKAEKVDRQLRSIDEAIDDLNRGYAISNADGPSFGHGGPRQATGNYGAKPAKPAVRKEKITDVGLAYQIRLSLKANTWYIGPVYVFTIDDGGKSGKRKATIPAARP